MTLPQNMLYKDSAGGGEVWRPVPPWAHFYELIGRIAARGVLSHGRLVIGLSVPHRYMAAPLVTLGALLSVVSDELVGVTSEQRFAELAALEPGTVLRFSSPGSDEVKLGTFVGSKIDNGKKYIVIEDPRGKGHLRTWMPMDYATNIQRTSLTADEIPKRPARRRGNHVSRRFLAAFLSDVDFEAFERDAIIESVLLGPGPALRQEIKDLQLGVRALKPELAEGTLNDLLRVREYVSSETAAWTEIHSTSGSRRLPERMKLNPRVAVFDGARGFLRWRKHFSDSAWVLVLDRHDTQFLDAVADLNSEYAQNSLVQEDIDIVPNLPEGMTIPPGVEATLFFRGR